MPEIDARDVLAELCQHRELAVRHARQHRDDQHRRDTVAQQPVPERTARDRYGAVGVAAGEQHTQGIDSVPLAKAQDKVGEDERDARQLNVQSVGEAAHLHRAEEVSRNIERQEYQKTHEIEEIADRQKSRDHTDDDRDREENVAVDLSQGIHQEHIACRDEQVPFDPGAAEQIEPCFSAEREPDEEDDHLEQCSCHQIERDASPLGLDLLAVVLLLEQSAQKDEHRGGERVAEHEPAAEHIAAAGEFIRDAADDHQNDREQLDVIIFEYSRFETVCHDIFSHNSMIY